MSGRDEPAPTVVTQGGGAEYPHLYRVGAYLFFGWLAFWSTTPVYALCRWLHIPEGVRSLATYAVLVATFFALRDMTKRSAPVDDARRGGA